MSSSVTVSFHGVRGSTPCSSPRLARFGGNTSCVVIEREGESPIVCDIGTGLRFYGLSLAADHFVGSMLVTHLHWDHVQGLPFFPQLLHPASDVRIYGPPEPNLSFEDALAGFVQPPYFPVPLSYLGAQCTFHDIDSESVTIGSATVTAAPVPHTGITNGYRIEFPEASIVYVPDHQQAADGSLAESVVELAREADLLIHDAQFTPELLEDRPDWGHCTPTYASEIAEAAGVKRLAMFHHDPLHDDEMVEKLVTEQQSAGHDFEVFGAAEGLRIRL